MIGQNHLSWREITLTKKIGMEAIEELKNRLTQIKAPIGGEKVFKDECAFSFDNPVSMKQISDKSFSIIPLISLFL